MASVSPLLIIILAVVAVVTIVLIILVVQSRRTSITTTSSASTAVCTNPPGPPQSVSITNPTADILTLTWGVVSTATGYTAYLGNSPGFNTADAIQTRVTKSTSVSFGNLALGVTYYAKVLATNACGNSALSNEVSYTLVYQFPTRFIMASSNAPTFHACDNHDALFGPSDQVAGSRFCNNTDQVAFRNTSDSTIRQSSRPGYCLTRDAGAKVFYHPCVVNSSQQWVYNTLDKSLCSLSNPNGNCLQFQAGFTTTDALGSLTYGNKTTARLYQWDIDAI